jgi:hypothetical protein
MHFQSPDEIHEADPGNFCYRSWAYNSQQTAFHVSDIDLETTAGFHLLKEVKIWKGIPTASTYLNSAPWHPNQKTPSEVTYKDQNNTAHTSGANHKPPSKLLTKIRTTQCTHLVQSKTLLRSYWQRSEERSAHINISLVEAPTIEYYYYYYYYIFEDASMHNVTMRIVANGFDDALHIAFGETLLAAHERWMGSSLTMSREDECIMNRPVAGVLGWWPVERAGELSCSSYACEWMNEWRKEGRTDGWTDGRTTNW